MNYERDSQRYDYHPEPELHAHRAVLENYCTSEQQAILAYRRYVASILGRVPTLEEAVELWERDPAQDWRARKLLCDARAQVEEIERYRQGRSRECGRQLDFSEAAREWVSECAELWRQAREQTGFPETRI